ncbi:MAG: hypothetical protein ACI8PZ_001745 [Myxococcota bacterium]|jgi:hypothetical protein
MNELDAAWRLCLHPNFKWQDGMSDRSGARVSTPWEASNPPDLDDWATAGLIFGQLATTGRFTDVVRLDGYWVVAIRTRGPDVRGLAGDSFGEAAAWALLAVWGDPMTLPPSTVPMA